MDTQLKVLALQYVKIHDNLIKEEKLALGNFIMEASDDQVKFLLLSGEVKDNLTQEDLDLVKESWQSQWLSTGQQAGLAGQAATAGFAAALAIKAGMAVYKRHFSQAAKACKGMSGPQKTNCMEKFKQKANVAKTAALKSGLGKCSKSKDPGKCKAQIQKELSKMGAA